MVPWSSFSYAFGPLVALAGVGVLALVLRWAYARGGSLVERPVHPGRTDDYGLLVPVAAPPTAAEAERLRLQLAGHGLRVTVAETVDGPRVLVFAGDAGRARSVLAQPPPS